MGETLFSMIRDWNLIAYKSVELREHVLNAVAVATPGGVRMVKGKSTKKIDAAMALVSAVSMGPSLPLSDFIEPNRNAPERVVQKGRRLAQPGCRKRRKHNR
jgi:phage terminase large subunit-like protein